MSSMTLRIIGDSLCFSRVVFIFAVSGFASCVLSWFLGQFSSGSLSQAGPSNHSVLLLLKAVVLRPRVSRSAGFVNVGQNLQSCSAVISLILHTRV